MKIRLLKEPVTNRFLRLLSMCLTMAFARAAEQHTSAPPALHVGAAAAEFEADDSMIIAGGITPGKAGGQEGKLRAVAVVLEQKPFGKLAIVACDVLMITR